MRKLILLIILSFPVFVISSCVYDINTAGVYLYDNGEDSAIHDVLPEGSQHIVYLKKAPFYPNGGYSFECSEIVFRQWANERMASYPERKFDDFQGAFQILTPFKESNGMDYHKVDNGIRHGSLIEDWSVVFAYDLNEKRAFFYYSTR